MECPRCYFDESAGGSKPLPCAVCGRSYRPAVNVYLGFVSLIYLVFVRYVSYILTGEFFELGNWPQQTIFEWARWPIDVQMRPEWHLILGAFLALLALVPVVMGLLYGKRGGYLLALIALVTGPSWVLGLMLFFSVWMAGGWTLRLHSKVASITLGCLPVWIYYLATSRPTVEVALPGAYFVPAVLSIVFSILLIGLIIGPLRVLRWNTRIVGIALIALLAGPIVSYKLFVGEDAVQYAFLSRDYGMESGAFRETGNGQIIQALRAEAERHVDEEHERLVREQEDFGTEPESFTPQERQRRVDARLDILKMEFETGFRAEMDRRRRLTIERAEGFLTRYPSSRHVPDALYIRAQAEDLRIDTSALRDARALIAPIRLDFDQCSPQTEPIWRRLLKHHAETRYAATALVKLAGYEARGGRIDEAAALYQTMVERYRQEVDQPLPDTSSLSIFTDLLSVGERMRQISRTRHIEEQYRVALAQQALLAENGRCPVCDGKTLRQYLNVSRTQPVEHRRQQLAQLLQACPRDPLADNIAYDLALLEPTDRLRMEALEQAVRDYPGRDGAALSLYEMARLNSSAEDMGMVLPERALRHYRELREKYPTFYLASTVEKQIAVLENAVRRATSNSSDGRSIP